MPKILKVKQVSSSVNGIFDDFDIEKPLNKALVELQNKNAEISRITYITNTRTGEITVAVIEYKT